MAKGITPEQITQHVTSIKFDGDDTIYHVGMNESEYGLVASVLTNEYGVNDDGTYPTTRENAVAPSREYNERIREINEQERKSNEIARQSEEVNRKNAEQIRSDNEGKLGSGYDAETGVWQVEGSGRLFAEQVRNVNEDKRIANENQRQENEDNRVIAENVRDENFNRINLELTSEGGFGQLKATNTKGEITTVNVDQLIADNATMKQNYYVIDCSGSVDMDTLDDAGDVLYLGKTRRNTYTEKTQAIPVMDNVVTAITTGKVSTSSYFSYIYDAQPATAEQVGLKKNIADKSTFTAVGHKTTWQPVSSSGLSAAQCSNYKVDYLLNNNDEMMPTGAYYESSSSQRLPVITTPSARKTVYLKKITKVTNSAIQNINRINVLFDNIPNANVRIKTSKFAEIYDNFVAMNVVNNANSTVSYGGATSKPTYIYKPVTNVGLTQDGEFVANAGSLINPSLVSFDYFNNVSSDGQKTEIISYETDGNGNLKLYTDSQFKETLGVLPNYLAQNVLRQTTNIDKFYPVYAKKYTTSLSSSFTKSPANFYKINLNRDHLICGDRSYDSNGYLTKIDIEFLDFDAFVLNSSGNPETGFLFVKDFDRDDYMVYDSDDKQSGSWSFVDTDTDGVCVCTLMKDVDENDAVEFSCSAEMRNEMESAGINEETMLEVFENNPDISIFYILSVKNRQYHNGSSSSDKSSAFFLPMGVYSFVTFDDKTHDPVINATETVYLALTNQYCTEHTHIITLENGEIEEIVHTFDEQKIVDNDYDKVRESVERVVAEDLGYYGGSLVVESVITKRQYINDNGEIVEEIVGTPTYKTIDY